MRSSSSESDDHQATTCHVYCQKVLKEETLLTGTIFDLEAGREDLRLARAVERYWREFVHRHQGSDAGRSYINKLIARSEERRVGEECRSARVGECEKKKEKDEEEQAEMRERRGVEM